MDGLDWETPSYPPRTSSRWPAPGVFLNVEFGVSFSPADRIHSASMNYTSRNMQDRLFCQQQEEELHYWRQHPQSLTPGADSYHHHSRQYQQQRQRRLGVRPLEQHQRGSSAPPTITDPNPPISPISPVSPMTPVQPPAAFQRAATERPLPPLPSTFRLGEDGLPWSVPLWYGPSEPEVVSPTAPRASPRRGRSQSRSRRVEHPSPSRSLIHPMAVDEYVSPSLSRASSIFPMDMEPRRLEDPQRVRDLGRLHQAMMTVDSLSHDGWESWTWEDSVGDMPRGPRSLGWAVSSTEIADAPPPPPYVVSQYEQAFRRNGSRRRSSGL